LEIAAGLETGEVSVIGVEGAEGRELQRLSDRKKEVTDIKYSPGDQAPHKCGVLCKCFIQSCGWMGERIGRVKRGDRVAAPPLSSFCRLADEPLLRLFSFPPFALV